MMLLSTFALFIYFNQIGFGLFVVKWIERQVNRYRTVAAPAEAAAAADADAERAGGADGAAAAAAGAGAGRAGAGAARAQRAAAWGVAAGGRSGIVKVRHSA